ncbi:ABC transporter substrate-binding protein [Hungatella sp.]|jgi:putative aldouronate transport system substrate-binding protein|uniref:ABC transporter substrate-binding protein n=1 Tax=Hungatella sp. TaxID=2613924 RepID=UPI002A841631|nr:ABC transporter substrate-binding protein [Hungatella sp.]
MKKTDVWKKAAAAGLAALLAVGTITGCAAKTDTKETGTPAGDTAEKDGASAKDTAAADPAGGDIPTLVYWTVGGTTPSDFDQDIAAINEYLEEKIHVKLDLKVAGWGDYEKKMNTIINSGEYFDMMFVNNTNYSRFVKMGAFEDISDKLQSVAPELYEMIPEQLWKGVTIGGKVYSVPTYKDSSMAQFWYFDDQYVQKYNIDLDQIKTMQDLDKPFRDMKEGEGKGFYPLQMSQGSPFNGFFNEYDGLTSGLQPLGVKVDDQTRTVICTLDQPDIMENLKLLHQWYMDGIINPDANVLTEPQKKLPFSSAQGWPSAVATWQVLNGVEKYDAFKVFGPLYSTDTIQGSMNAVSINSKYKDECLKFLQLVNTDSKLRDMLAYGVPDKTFKYVGDGVIEKQTDTWPLAAYTQGTFFNMSITEDADPDQWDQVKKQNEEAVSSSCLGFSLDLTNIQNEMSNCLTVWQKYKYDLLTGASDSETAVPAVIQELKAAGFDTVIQEAQKQINEFYN